jgi:hypothetical protein
MSSAPKAESKITNFAKRNGCTPTGIIWLKNTLDPFPDTKRELVGYPDTVKTPSIVQYFKEQLNVTAPAEAAGGNWDATIFHPGWENGFLMGGNTADSSTKGGIPMVFYQSGQSTFSNATGMVEVRAQAAGINGTPNKIVQAINPQVDFNLPHRLVNLGFEVYNTTAEIYKQGTCITWRQPAVISSDTRTVASFHASTGPVLPTPIETVLFNNAPETSSQALILEGSLEWKASEGAYVVGVLSEPTNEPKSLGDQRLAVIKSQSSGFVYRNSLAVDGGGDYVYPVTPALLSAFDQFGVSFYGLSNQSTLQVILHYVIERFPTLSNTDLITLARPSIPYDPAAIELYTTLASEMATGTEVKNNFSGDWISGIAQVITGLAPHVAKGVNNWLNPGDEERVAKLNNELHAANLRAMMPLVNPEMQDYRDYLKYAPPRQRQIEVSRDVGYHGSPQLISLDKYERKQGNRVVKAMSKGKVVRQGPLTKNNKFKSEDSKQIKKAGKAGNKPATIGPQVRINQAKEPWAQKWAQ